MLKLIPKGFPCRLDVPLFYVFTARVTFQNINGEGEFCQKGKMAHPHTLLLLTISILVISLNCDNCNAAIAKLGYQKASMDLKNLDLDDIDEWVNCTLCNIT